MADLSLRPGEEHMHIGPLPVGSAGRKSSGWFGMITLIATEASLFLYLLFSYFYFAIWSNGAFLPDALPKFELSGPDTMILLLSSVAVWWGEKGARKGSRLQLSLGLFGGIVLGAVFVGVQLLEWAGKPYRFSSSPYSSLYFTITGFHLAHVVVGMLVLLVLLVWSLLGYFDAKRHAPVAIGAVYWHFVDAVWLAVFFTIYVTPHLG
ncbi:heme-copper oxidase subunit III [Mesorhizobium sp. ES1-3]|uniref:cytochrome c oxidase subunit 3 n=1 Tax=Mesorhizobium sp. ES1-3 TaxID=2876628 RepID=UPI001CCA8A08|nr:cytochrome c oxidase subunit 3 [Mesorhizobium sp. ES1-3]MBZ9673668.1 cytochrome c oxidase subunit 3 [Mesorhizobium sp. ES1-3]